MFGRRKRERKQAELEAREDFRTEVLSRLARIEYVLHPGEVENTPTVIQSPTLEQVLQEAADANREHAAEKFGEVLFSRDGEWYETASGEPVVFTPHGWRLAKDIAPFELKHP